MARSEDAALVAAAARARDHALAAFSGYRVGAALRTAGGTVYTGCNLENAIFGLSACAEVVALFKALSEGERSFDVMAVVADGVPAPVPCGQCRQLLHHWAVRRVIVADTEGRWDEVGIDDLLPRAFDLREPVR